MKERGKRMEKKREVIFCEAKQLNVNKSFYCPDRICDTCPDLVPVKLRNVFFKEYSEKFQNTLTHMEQISKENNIEGFEEMKTVIETFLSCIVQSLAKQIPTKTRQLLEANYDSSTINKMLETVLYFKITLDQFNHFRKMMNLFVGIAKERNQATRKIIKENKNLLIQLRNAGLQDQEAIINKRIEYGEQQLKKFKTVKLDLREELVVFDNWMRATPAERFTLLQFNLKRAQGRPEKYYSKVLQFIIYKILDNEKLQKQYVRKLTADIINCFKIDDMPTLTPKNIENALTTIKY